MYSLIEIEQELSIKFPKSYIELVNSKDYTGYLNDLPFISHLEDKTGVNILDATSILHLAREDCYNYAVIRNIDNRYLLIKCEGNNDSPLFEVDIDNDVLPNQIHKSLQKYIKEALQNEEKKRKVFKQVNKLQNLIPKEKKTILNSPFKKVGKINIPKLKSNDWKIIRSCIHDKIVGISAYKYNERENWLEVVIFSATDHPLYEKFNGVKSLLNSLFSSCYKLGVPFNIAFREDFYENHYNGRTYINARGNFYIPEAVMQFLNDENVTFEGAKILEHDISLKIYALILGISNEQIKKIENSEIPLESICFIISNTIWEIEEIEWFLDYSKKVKEPLIGEFDKTNRLKYVDSLNYSRLRLAMTKFNKRLSYDKNAIETENMSKKPLVYEFDFDFMIVKSTEIFNIPWLYDNEYREVKPDESLKIIFRTSDIQFNSYSLLMNEIEKLKEQSQNNEIVVFIYIIDYLTFFKAKKFETQIIQTIQDNPFLYIGFLPSSFKDFDSYVEKKWKNCKTIRL